jgi:heparan-alpha-glucosaminide N-acetyltransferase
MTIPAESSRILSIDIFRGLTMLVMIFVNDVASIKGLPWWTYHLPANVNGLTYVDMVFPFFLFIVGMAIPLSLTNRLAKRDSTLQLWKHVLARALSLVALGLLIMNGRQLDPQLSGIKYGWWNVLMFAGVILFWNSYPRSVAGKNFYFFLKYIGLLLIVVLLLLYRRKSAEGLEVWLNLTNWAILGAIGWAYLSVCLLYIPFRKYRWAPPFLLLLLCAMTVFSKLEWGNFLRHLPSIVWPFGTGALASITMAGLVASQIFLDGKCARTFQEKARWAVVYAVALFLLGWVLSPFGISKIRATPTWCLFCSSASTVIFLALYWLVDVKRITRWAEWIKPAGSNTLLTYLLPDVFYAIFGLYYLSEYMGAGWLGVLRSLLFTAFILGWTTGLTRLRIRLQL